jgi:hypothetical protein
MARAEGQSTDPVLDDEQGCEALSKKMSDEQHESKKREEGKQIGLEILALREVVECAIALRPRDDDEEESDEKQEHAAQQEEDPRQPVWGFCGQLRFSTAGTVIQVKQALWL